MDDASKPVAEDADPEQADKGLRVITSVIPPATNLALIAWNWGQWDAVLALVVTAACLTVTNSWLVEWWARRLGRPMAETLRMLANAAGFWVCGHYTQWAPLIWIYLPYNMLWFYALDRWVLARIFAFLALVAGFALWDGASPELVLAFALLGTFGYLFTAKRLGLLREAVRQAEQQRAQLQQAHLRLQHAHERALAQEKLSSLGMMAAGVAHEINNPMSFVTSNLSLLLKDLRQLPALPEPLKEYVDEVLPETLEGVKRVNAIVADLRRFARGDPEAYVEYDLNVQVQSALRLAHAQLGHCQVEEALGEVGQLVGRPQQIIRVLMTILINAGQATPEGGRVRVSTHQEAQGARVEIRDTGPGLSPEALRHLFQPFFTTRPHGVGMGLGLAVAHGIVTSHGGRIEVDSPPGQGTCITVHLPHTPPLPTYHRPTDAADAPLRA
jgi:signal transduction histidine kinase